MNNQTLGMYLKIGGIVEGVVIAILLLKWHPVLVILLALGAGIYFVGDYISKK